MERNFDKSLAEVLKHEGGWADHPKDPGGATNKGITIAVFRKWVKRNGTVEDLKNITPTQIATVYQKHYWNVVRGDDLPSGIDYAVFDFAVNSGPTRAAKYLQRVVGAKVDGRIGPKTILATMQMPSAEVIERLCTLRMNFLRSLKTWPTFRNGWTARVSAVETYAKELSAQKATDAAKPRPATHRPDAPKNARTPSKMAGTGIAAIVAFLLATAWAWGEHIINWLERMF